MKRYGLIATVFLLVFLLGVGTHAVRNTPPLQDTKETEALKIVFPQADKFSPKYQTPPHYKAYNIDPQTKKEKLIGIGFLTTDIAPEIQGYSGPIEIMVGADTSGTIANLHLISHAETTAYVANLNEFIKQFSSLHPHSAFKLGEDINGITRATITSQAITQAIQESLKIISQQVLSLEDHRKPSEEKRLPLDQVIIPLLIFTAAILGVLFKNTLFRWISLSAGFLYLGIMTSTMISTVQIANLGLGRTPSFADSPLWYFLLGGTFLSSLLIGNVYCGSICPFPIIEEILFNISKKIFPAKPAISPNIDKKARYLKHLTLICVIGISLTLGNADAAGVEPFLTLFTAHGSKLAWAFLGLMLFASLFHFRFWCKYLCPIGALNGLISRFSIFNIKVENNCTRCKTCSEICPTQAILLDQKGTPAIDYPECILCGKCMQQCPENALHFRRRAYEKT